MYTIYALKTTKYCWGKLRNIPINEVLGSWVRRLKIPKMSILSKLIHRVHEIVFKILFVGGLFSQKLTRWFDNSYGNAKGSRIAKSSMIKKKKSGGQRSLISGLIIKQSSEGSGQWDIGVTIGKWMKQNKVQKQTHSCVDGWGSITGLGSPVGKGQSFQKIVLGQLDVHMQAKKKKKRTWIHTLHYIWGSLKMDYRFKCKT